MPLIRTKAVCLFRHGNKILLAEGYDPTKEALFHEGEAVMSQAFQTIPEAIAAWAQHVPEQVALLAEGREPIGYGKLVEQAHQFCRALDVRGVTPSQRVALCIEDRPSLALPWTSNRPIPGTENTVSMMNVPVRRAPASAPIIVIIGTKAFLST